MLTLDTILNELKNVPADRLEDIYSIIHSFRIDAKSSNKVNKEILAYAGSFSDMPESDYADFQQHTKETRNALFDRDIDGLKIVNWSR